MALRRYTFKLYPNRAQEDALREQARLCAVLWNALLQMREDHYRRAKLRGEKKTSLTAFDQGKDITALNQAAKVDPDLAEWRLVPRGTQERVADMLDLAMKAFFKRAKGGAGASSGYPRYKSTRYAENIPLREPTKSCWKFEPKSSGGGCHSGAFSENGKREIHSVSGDKRSSVAEAPQTRGGDRCEREPRRDDRVAEAPQSIIAADSNSPQTSGQWRLTLRGVPGAIKARGRFPIEPLAYKTGDIKFHDGSWWFSICVEIPERRAAGAENLRVELDLIDQFAVVKTADGQCVPGLSDPFSKGRESEIPKHNAGLQAIGCGDSADAGDAQVDARHLRLVVRCGDSSDAGDAQASAASLRRGRGCGDSSDAGDAQAFNAGLQCSESCGDSADAGDAQASSTMASRRACCGDSADAGGAPGIAQTRTTDAIQSARDRRYKRGSIRWRREKSRIARIKARTARRNREALHRWTTAIVARAKELHVIAPPVRQMTKTGRGSEQFPGAEVTTVAMLNRHVLATAPGSAVQMLEYKAAEAGIACNVERREDHQIRIGGELRAAAIANKRAKRVVKRKERKAV